MVTKTTKNSLRIVELLKDLDGATITELNSALSLSKSTIQRHLNTLKNCRFVIKEENTYYISARLLQFGEYTRFRKPEYSLAEKKVYVLSDQSNELANFCVEEHGMMYVLFNSMNIDRDPAFKIGRSFYMHNSAIGKAILAEYDDKRVNAIIERWGLPDETDRTITSRKELEQELEKVQQQGYAFNDEEELSGLRVVGAAIKRPDTSIVGGISVGGPSYRITDEKLNQELTPQLLDVVNELETEIKSIYIDS